MSEAKKNGLFIARVLKLEITPHSHAWHPPTDIIEAESGFIVRVEIAGMAEHDFSINYDNSTLIILGKRSSFDTKCAYHRMEILYGDFSAYVQLPDVADVRKASAEYDNGFLTIFVPKIKPVNINITSKKEI